MPSVSGHSPLISGDTGILDEAMFIPDPTKSWAIYGELHEGREMQYYRFEIRTGQNIYISLMKPTNPKYKEFMPGFVLMGPGLNNSGNNPDYVDKPALANAVVVLGVQPEEATYEPFAPSSFYKLAELNISAPESGTYYIAVFEPLQGGHYSLAIGQSEAFSIIEWICQSNIHIPMGRTESDHDFITGCCNSCFRSHIIMEKELDTKDAI